nr:hypothetical protein GCM10020185_17450 [Pseudomonas brassicacearum subsp. brassicacearum]
MARVKVDWEMNAVCAAAEMEPVSATAMKWRIWRRVIMVEYPVGGFIDVLECISFFLNGRGVCLGMSQATSGSNLANGAGGTFDLGWWPYVDPKCGDNK